MSDLITTSPFTSASFDQNINEHKLMLVRCTQCGSTHAAPRAICPKCHNAQLEWIEASGKGKLAAFTVIYSGPTFMLEQGFDRKNPYISGIVILDEGPSISARITGVDALKPEDIHIGSPLSVHFIEFGEAEAKRTTLAFQML